jgi:hypothetical protein
VVELSAEVLLTTSATTHKCKIVKLFEGEFYMSFLRVRSWQTLAVVAVVALALTLTLGAFAQTASADGHEAMVSVYHGINGKSAAAKLLGDPKALSKDLPVNVFVDGVQVAALDNLKFRETRGPLALPPGTYNIVVKLAVNDLPVINQDVTVAGGDNVLLRAKMKGSTPYLQIK